MSIVARDIPRAIYLRATTDATLPGLLSTTTSVFEYRLADEDHAMPYVVFSELTVIPLGLLSEQATLYEDATYRFNAFDDSEGSTTIRAVLNAIEGAFGVAATKLSFADSTYKHIHSERTSYFVENHGRGIWQATADYAMRFKRL